MIMKAFAIFDSKSKSFLQPWFAMANGAALRAFGDAVNDRNTPMAKHPGDYQLYEIGEFDDGSGKLEPLVPIVMLGSGSEYVEVSPKANGMPLEEFGLKRPLDDTLVVKK